MSQGFDALEQRLCRFQHRARNTMQLVCALVDELRGCHVEAGRVDELSRAVRVAFLLEEATWDCLEGNVAMEAFLSSVVQAALLEGPGCDPDATGVDVLPRTLTVSPQSAFALGIALAEILAASAGDGSWTATLEASASEYRLFVGAKGERRLGVPPPTARRFVEAQLAWCRGTLSASAHTFLVRLPRG